MSKKDEYLKNKIINLVSISTKDRTIFTKLNSNDIYNPLIFYNLKDLNNLFKNNKIAKLSHKNDWSKIESDLSKIDNVKEFLKFLEDKSLFIPKSKVNLLLNSFTFNKDIVLDYLKSKFEILDKKLANLDTMAKTREVDTGDWCLYLARYFLTGSLTNGEMIKAPIIFKEVNIDLLDASLKDKEGDMRINEKLIVHLIKQEKKSALLLKEWNEINNIDDAINYLNLHFDFNLFIPSGQNEFVNEDMPKARSRMLGKLMIEDQYIFGFFRPNGGKLKQDLEHIIDIKADVFGDETKVKIFDPEKLILDKDSKWIQISSLNLSQLFALNLSINSNTIIHGPPGTGKSETIANIIANIMMNNKTALMVSEKKAALDVLLDRLGPLKDFGMFFQDTKITKDKVIFYKIIKNLGDIYASPNLVMPDFSYSENILNYLIKEKNNLNRAYRITQIMKQWNIGNFDYNDYLAAKYEILDENTLTLIKKHKLQYLTKIEFFSLEHLAILLLHKNILNPIDAEIFHLQMKKSFDDFENDIENLNNFWNPLGKFDLRNLTIMEIKSIERAQPRISELSQKHPDIIKMFEKDIFIYEDLEKYYFELEKFCDELKIKRDILIKIMVDNQAHKILDAVNKVGILEKKYVISNWYLMDEIKTSNLKKIKITNWKQIILLIEKIVKYIINFDDFFVYLKNKKILSSLNVFFFIKGFVFVEYLTDFIENHWLKFDSILPVVIYSNKITFVKAELASKVFKFEKYYNDDENQALIYKYAQINDSVYSEKDIDWNIIIQEIYQRLIISWKEKINNTSNKEDIIEIFRLSNLKRFPKIKTFMKKYFSSLLELFPIWISRPEDVSDIIECEGKIFDYGIFDEASQMFLERAYPILYRTDIKIVAGDDKQLKPSSFFNTRYNEKEDEDEEENEAEETLYKIQYKDLDSLLLRAIVSNWNEILLNNHYRSISQDLIEFSNKNIYDNNLNVASFNKSFNSKPFEVIDVDGFFVNRVNKEEAQKVLEVIVGNLDNYQKILVITFNESQAGLIISQILSSKNKEIIMKMRESRLIITNLENVQGNEGDLVILSIAYGKPSAIKKMRNSFGPLNMEGGKNRLNVAVTRSKHKMIVVKSFRSEDMSVSPTNLNAQCFKEFIVHCDNVSANIELEKKWLTLDSAFERDVSDSLSKFILERNGLFLLPKYKIGTKRIDIAIFDKYTNNVSLGIELHQWSYDNYEALKNFDNQAFIKTRGYHIFNIFEIDWRKNKQKIIREIVNEVKLNR